MRVSVRDGVCLVVPGSASGEKACPTRAWTLRRNVWCSLSRPRFRSGLFVAVRDDQAGAAVAAVGDHRGRADGVLRAGQFPCLAVVAVAGQWPADGDHESGVGIDDDLVVGGVPVVLRLLGDGVIASGYQGPSTISTASLRNRLRCWSASAGPRWSMMRSAADFDTPNSGASWRRVRLVRQYAATSRTRSSSGRLQGRPLRTGSAPSRRNAVINLPNCRGLSPVNGAIQDGSDAVITSATTRSSHL